ncbi:transcription termination factor 3, mitochondrial [Diorhabda sublineata]|uniref:transcription termination factor 3, mitochondrial n=1 Tax=Diorhabda sublineata TaxID=1163346 RepID=UPI0024E1928F|nr:transcription termination factor 3, mitochondrial [Diorhabda sublineata]
MFTRGVGLNVIRILRNITTIAENNSAAVASSLETLKNKDTELTGTESLISKPQRMEISEISKILRPGALSSVYVNKSEILQELVKLGTKLYVIEKEPEAIKLILSLKFDDIKDTIIFLKDLGIEIEDIGNLITKNPFIFKENLEDLKVRINYLQYKKFTSEMIVRIIRNNPFWLSHSTADIDNRLGFYQKNFMLSGNEIRSLTTKCPRLITFSLDSVKCNIFSLKEEMGFTPEEMKLIILRRPQLFKSGRYKLLQTFDYLHNKMKIPLETIVETPEILSCRERRLRERHLFLVKLGKNQYSPKKPNYIGLKTLISGTDAYFSTEIANSSVQMYNEFLKSL